MGLGAVIEGRSCLLVHGMDDWSCLDINSCAGDMVTCTGFVFFMSCLMVCTVLSARPFD